MTMDLPTFECIRLERRGRRLTIVLNRPELLNAFGKAMHVEMLGALDAADRDPHSDVIVLTGAGRAFSAGGDLARLEEFVSDPSEFEREAADAKRIVFRLLDIEKPVIARVNGHAVGLGATLALFCDVVFAARSARIGDPHVNVGLVAGDGGAAIWPQLVGFARAKEYLMTGELIPADEAARMGLINHSVADEDLDARVDELCDRLLAGSARAIRWTKTAVNIELKRITHGVMDAGIAYESLTVRSPEFRDSVQAMRKKISQKRGD